MAIAVDPAQVRALLDVTLTADELSDATIALDAYAGRATDIVSRWLRELNLVLPDDDPIVVRSANLETAALIATALPMITREAVPDYQQERTKIDRAAQAAELESQAYATLTDAALDIVGTTGDTFEIFGKAEGRRGLMYPWGGRKAEGALPGPA